MVHQIFFILAALCCCFCYGIMATDDNNQLLRSVPCPPAEDILPCVCTVDSSYEMEMDCSSVTTSDELASIFNQEFSYKNFYKLVINHNYNLKIIRVGDLGQNTFQEIYIQYGSLETIEYNAFMPSYDKLTKLDIQVTMLHSFPFNEIVSFTQLQQLELGYNQLSGSPAFVSSTLRYLRLSGNPISGIALNSLPLLEQINLVNTAITNLYPGTFTGLPKLDYLHLGDNGLQFLEAGTINLQTSSNIVNLYLNSLTSIAEGALVGLRGGALDLDGNLLTELAEGVFRPLMDAGVTVRAYGNPLACGCEIAWLVTNPTYMGLLDDGATCTTGDLVSDLDPGMFPIICP